MSFRELGGGESGALSRTVASLLIRGRMSRRWRQEMSDRVHAAGDAAAHSHGWTVTQTTAWSDFGGREYRDHRFATRGLPGSSTGHHRSRPCVITACDPPGDPTQENGRHPHE
jgi:hypothetical protein